MGVLRVRRRMAGRGKSSAGAALPGTVSPAAAAPPAPMGLHRRKCPPPPPCYHPPADISHNAAPPSTSVPLHHICQFCLRWRPVCGRAEQSLGRGRVSDGITRPTTSGLLIIRPIDRHVRPRSGVRWSSNGAPSDIVNICEIAPPPSPQLELGVTLCICVGANDCPRLRQGTTEVSGCDSGNDGSEWRQKEVDRCR